MPPVGVDGCGSIALTVTSNFQPGDAFPLGITQVDYLVTDFSGNTGTCNFIVSVSDTIAPFVICPPDVNVFASDTLNCAAIVDFAVDSVGDNCDVDLLTFSNPGTGTTFPVGTSAVEFTVVDDFGNSSTCQFNVIVVDTLSPQIICPMDTLVYVAQDTCGAFPFWDAPTVMDDCTHPDSLNPSGSAMPGEFLPLGANTISYLVADAFGNVNSCSFVVTVADTLAPQVISCPNNFFIDLPVNACDTMVTWTPALAEDNCGIDTTYSSHMPGDPLGTGTTTVTYWFEDASGNIDSCSFDITVLDQIAPVISDCPSDTVITGVADCGIVLDWQLPTITDNCDPNPTLSSSHMPTDTFTTGQTNVLIIGSDLSGNYDTCSFSVTIISDVTPGFANVPMDMEFMGCDAIVNWTEPDAVGFCVTPDTIYSNYMPGDTFPIGTTTVIYTAVDELGLEYTASFTITVTDPEPPVVSCPEPIVVNAGALVLSDPDGFVLSIDTLGDCSGVNMLLDIPVASDNCDSVALVQTTGPVPGEDYPIGSYTVTYLATDISGNTAECAFEVTVLPLRLMDAVVTPNPGCPGDFVTLTVDSFPGATYTWTGPQMSYPNSHQITIVSLSAGNAGLYTVQAEINGCLTPVDSVEVQVAIEPIAEDDLDFEVVAGEMLDSFYVTLNDIFLPDDAIITLLNPINGLTNFGDGLFSYDATDAAAGKVSFVYEICSETCPDLCDMATVTITVNQADCSFIPNIFTPNGDNVNDYLRIPCLDSGRYGQNSLYIYNQWGDQVFMASPYQNTMPTAWTGTFENQPGKDLPDGTYFYIFVPSPNDAPIKGFIEIYR
jgi:gliding motility-associated-like protein